MQKPFAVIVTTSASDLSTAAMVAAAARAAGAVVETPIAHSPVERQVRRAKAMATDLVAIVSGGTVEIVGIKTAHWSVSQADVAGDQIAAWFQAETCKPSEGTVITVTIPRYDAQAGLPKAA